MKFVADESVDGPIVAQLRADGHDVLFVAELDPGIRDEKVLSIANDRTACLITQDTDFGEIVFRQRRLHHGIVLIRLEGLAADTKAAIVSAAVKEIAELVYASFTVVSANMVRVRPRD